MKKTIWIVGVACALSFSACENKSGEAEPASEAETTEEAVGPSGVTPHVDTNREAFKAAGKAAAQIEGKQADRNAAADDALNAGK